MTARDNARRKIQSLLALANRPGTPEEGETALAMAHKLATKHGLKIQKRTASENNLFGGLSDALRNIWETYEQSVDRSATEAQAAAHAKRRAQEVKRKATRIRRVREQGAQAFRDGKSVVYVPFKFGTTFGVNQRVEWIVGWRNEKMKAEGKPTRPRSAT